MGAVELRLDLIDDTDFGRRLAEALPRLRRHCARRAPGLDAEDVAQEVVGRALRYAGSFDEGRALWPWLRQVAERVLSDAFSERAGEPESLDALGVAVEVAVEPAAAQLDELDELRAILGRLRPVERDVLVRFHRAEQSVAEIAEALGCPVGTVKSHLSRARRRLAELGEER